MLSLETQTRLAELVMKVADCERQVEVTRQVLAELIDFEPYSALRHLDRFATGALTSRDFREFLEAQRVACSDGECGALVKQYDGNNDGRLSLTEFYNLVLPACNPARRDIVLTRSPQSAVTYDVQYALTRLLEREIIYQREVDSLRRALASRFDFNTMDAFRCIDAANLSYIDRISLRGFLVRCGYAPYDEDLDAIMRRMDTDGDERLSYLEFMEGILVKDLGGRTLARSPVRVSSPDRRSSPLRKSMGSFRHSASPSKFSVARASSPLKPSASSLRRSSPFKASRIEDLSRSTISSSIYRTPEKRTHDDSLTPLRNSMARSFQRSERLSLSPLPPSEELELVSALKQQVDHARDLEAAKVDLVLMPDFNLIDAFRIFDVENKGFITTPELEEGMEALGVRTARDEGYLMVRSFSKLSDSRLRFSDFSDMLTPKDEECSRMLSSREPYRLSLRDPREAFSSETLSRFANVLRLHLDSEALAESLRQKLSRRPRFNFYDAFQTIDKDRNGYITYDEFQGILEENGFLATNKDLKALMERYDKNRDGRVSYSEFVQEVTPKSPRKY